MNVESLSEFSMEMQEGDHFISMDIHRGYQHFRLHRGMRDWFVFRSTGKYYQCVALPFSRRRSPLWFTMLMAIFVEELRRWVYRTRAYLDDFLLALSLPGMVNKKVHCAAAAVRVNNVMKRVGLTIHPSKGVLTGATEIVHLGVKIDSLEMKFFIAERKDQRVMQLSKDLLRDVRAGRRWVPAKKLTHFCGVCVSHTLAMPWALFYTRSLYWDMAAGRIRNARGRVRLSHQSIRALCKWRDLSRQELSGLLVLPLHPKPLSTPTPRTWDMGHPPFRQSRTGDIWAVACTRYMGLAGPLPFHFFLGVASNPQATHGVPWSQHGRGVGSESTAACRQPSRGSHYQRTGLGKSFYDVRTSNAQSFSRSSRSAELERIDTVGCEPICRWPFATLPTRRFTDSKVVAAFRGGWYEGSNRYVQAPPSRGSSIAQEETSVRRTPAAMGQVGSSPPLPTSRPHHGNAVEVGSEPSPGNATYPGLATSVVVLEGVLGGEQGHAVGLRSTGYLGGVQEDESDVVHNASGSEFGINMRGSHRLQPAESVFERLVALLSSLGMHKAAFLLRHFS